MNKVYHYRLYQSLGKHNIWNDVMAVNAKEANKTIPTLTEIRHQVLDRVLWVLVSLGGLVVAYSTIQDFIEGNYLLGSFYIIIYLPLIFAFMLKASHYKLRAYFILLPLFIVAFVEIWNFGNESVGSLYLLTTVLLTCILLGSRTGFVAILISLIFLVLLAHWNTMREIENVQTSKYWRTFLLDWMPLIITHALLSVSAMIFIAYILQRLENNIKFTTTYAKELQNQITIRQQAEISLRESEDKFRSVFEKARDAITLADENGFIDCNIAALEMYGFSEKEELCAQHPGNVSPEVQPNGQVSISLANEHIKAAISGEAKLFEWTHRRTDGSVFPAEVQLSPITIKGKTLVQGVIRNISERKQAEMERARLATALEQAAEDIILTDIKGIIQFVNPAFEKNTGYRREEVIGEKTNFLNSGQHNDAFYKDIWTTIIRGDVWKGRIINKKKNGKLFTEESTISPILDSMGTPIGYIAIMRDISQQLLLEEQLREAQKMESVGRLAGGVAHDFNNCLQAILGYGELVRGTLDPQSKSYDDLGQVIHAANRTKELVRQLLAFSRRQVLELRCLDLADLVDNISKMLRRLIGEHITLHVNSLPGISPVLADRGAIEQTLVNLCINARDAMPTGGEINIIIENASLSPNYFVEHSWKTSGSYVLLIVTDNGHGMDEEVQAKIFEPFFTTKGIGEGTGLGLATVYGMVKQHNGYIYVYSESGVGTTFKIYLPALVSQRF